MQTEHLSTRMALIGEGQPKLAAEAIEKRIGELATDGWTVNGIVPLSYSPPLGGAHHQMIITEVIPLISK